MALLNNYLKLKELTDDLEFNGILEKYDDTSPYIYAELLDIDAEALSKLSEVQELSGRTYDTHELLNNCVFVFRRVTKIRGFRGIYAQLSDLIEIIPRETYNKYVYKQ